MMEERTGQGYKAQGPLENRCIAYWRRHSNCFSPLTSTYLSFMLVILDCAQGFSQVSTRTFRAVGTFPSNMPPRHHMAALTPHSQLSCQQRGNLMSRSSPEKISHVFHGCPQSLRSTPGLAVPYKIIGTSVGIFCLCTA